MGGILTRLCQGTAVINSLLSLLPTYAAWKRKALGPGERLPDPIVSALFANAAWFAFGLIEKSNEATRINAFGGLCQLVNLGNYISLCNPEERFGVLKRFVGAVAYLALTVRVGLAHDSVELFKLMCTLSGLAAAFTPWIITLCMTQPKTVDLLPHWGISLFSFVNGVVWVIRGLKIWNIPLAVQNGAGAFCAFWFLVLLFAWNKPENNKYPPLLIPPGTSLTRDDGLLHLLVPPGTSQTRDDGSSDSDDETEKKSDKSGIDTIKANSSDYMTDTDDESSTNKASGGTSTSAQKEVAINVEKETGDNGGAPSETSPAPASLVSAPTAAQAKITQEAEKETGGDGSAPNKTSPAPATPVSDPTGAQSEITQEAEKPEIIEETENVKKAENVEEANKE